MNDIKSCKKCNKCMNNNSKFATCNKCRVEARYKIIKNNNPNAKICSSCHKILETGTQFKTCQDCRLRREENKDKLSVVIKCKEFNKDGSKCNNYEFLKGLCKIHFKNTNSQFSNELGFEHKISIAISTLRSKLSKEDINNIKNLHSIGLTQKEIIGKTGFSRGTIQKVLYNDIIGIDSSYQEKRDFVIKKMKKKEEKMRLKTQLSSEDYQKKVNEKNSINKMKLNIDTIIEILNYKFKTHLNRLNKKVYYSSTELSNTYKQNGIKVSNDMIKNYWSGKTKIPEILFKDKSMTYEEYIDLVNRKRDNKLINRVK